MFQDLTEREIREVTDRMAPAQLLYRIHETQRNWAILAGFDEARFSVFGKDAQVLLGFTEIGAWVADGPLVPGGEGTGRRFDRQDECLLLAAKILEEKGLLKDMQAREPFWYVQALKAARERKQMVAVRG